MLVNFMLQEITPYLFFTGKGGVGKTSLACAAALTLSDEGKRVLLISTDPASNLKEVLETDITDNVTPVSGTTNLFAVNIDPEQAAEEYRNRATAPLQGLLPDHEIAKMREELSGACTTEIAAFDEFTRYVTDGKKQPSGNGVAAGSGTDADGGTTKGIRASQDTRASRTEGKAGSTGEEFDEEFDIVIFDTAPTGHTLRLLELPAAWSDYIEHNPDGASCIGPSSALKTNKERYERVVARLRDPQSTTVYLVSRPEPSALKEADRSSAELRELGLNNQRMLINGYFEPLDKQDPFALKMKEMADQALAGMPGSLKELAMQTFPLRPYNLLGLDRLRTVFQPLDGSAIRSAHSEASEEYQSDLPGIDELIRDLTAGMDHGLIMTMGKGGVGKTVMAAAIARKLAQKGYPVHLTTTDPAAHIEDQIGPLDQLPETLTIGRIDPKKEKEDYIERVINSKSGSMSEENLKLLREDLESPCTEEVAVFQAFSKSIHQARRKFVVIDTAPTGHTLLLLDTTGSYHREVLRNASLDPDRMKTPFMYLQDPDFAKLLLVTIPETTPITEAAKLQSDLRRAGIEPWGWIANQSLSATRLSDPLLRQRAVEERPLLDLIARNHTENLYGVPFTTSEHIAIYLSETDRQAVIHDRM
ncbi:MAG: arsenical pump-driving ATPase [Balneolaceae bacterium]|nr:MAG: arsenical pump-driving ATPase [Balneolaceae bacterium]